MPERSLISVVNAIVPAPDHVSDSSLLRRYTDEGDHAAFELLFRRHAEIVWAACKGILRNDADAEDAFQATFLALTRRAKAVVAEATAAGWLHRVAVNAALKRLAARRPDTPIPHDIIDRRLPPTADDHDIIHQELNRLRDRDRLPVVLCDLEGHTREIAAAILGWPVGTVNGRLSRARDRLRERLLKRGVTAPTAFITLSVPHAIPARAAALTLNPSVVPESISHLATGALTAMTATKFKLTAVIAAGVLLTAGVGTMVAVAQPGPTAQTKTPEAIPVKDRVKRPAVKLADGRTVLFPDLAMIAIDPKMKEFDTFVKELKIDVTTPLEDGVMRIRWERAKTLAEMVKLNFEVLKSGQWDVTFFNQHLVDMYALHKAIDITDASRELRLKVLRTKTVLAYYTEHVCRHRWQIAGTLRSQQFYQSLAFRHGCELDLAAAEDAKGP